MRVPDVQLIFDSIDQVGQMGYSVKMRSAQPTYATTDDMLIDLVRQKWTKNAHTIVVTADRALAIQVTQVDQNWPRFRLVSAPKIVWKRILWGLNRRRNGPKTVGTYSCEWTQYFGPFFTPFRKRCRSGSYGHKYVSKRFSVFHRFWGRYCRIRSALHPFFYRNHSNYHDPIHARPGFTCLYWQRWGNDAIKKANHYSADQCTVYFEDIDAINCTVDWVEHSYIRRPS